MRCNPSDKAQNPTLATLLERKLPIFIWLPRRAIPAGRGPKMAKKPSKKLRKSRKLAATKPLVGTIRQWIKD